MGLAALGDAAGTPRRVPLRTIVLYGLPAAPVYFTFMLTAVYLLKYTTDVLLVAPGVMGVLYGLSRIWDAVSDPIAGYLSDRTRSRLGRRRSWLLASALPIALGFAMMWSPPDALSGAGLAAWLGLGVFVYFTGTTCFSIPHESLGAELSLDHHDRTRVFGIKTAVGQTGTVLALGGMYLIITAQQPRAAARGLVLVMALAIPALMVLAVSRLRERPEYQGRGATHLRHAFRDVLANPHAARLLLVFFVENFGTANLALLAPFVMQYVLDMERLTPAFIAVYFVPALLFIPVWIALSRRVGKKRLWLFSLSTMAVAFAGLFFVQPGDVALICVLGFVAGVGGGCGQVVGPSIQADVIDYDELHTGQRKEGAYFAVWNFMRKSAYGVAAMLAGALLSAVGFEANAAQSEETRLGMRLLFSLVPAACFLGATLAFTRFRLDEAEHDEIRRQLDARALARARAAAGGEG
jgi:GPH family glycoside/pentoside/hexuronide:cation symporter